MLRKIISTKRKIIPYDLHYFVWINIIIDIVKFTGQLKASRAIKPISSKLKGLIKRHHNVKNGLSIWQKNQFSFDVETFLYAIFLFQT